MDLIKDAIVAITKSILGGFLLSALKPAQNMGENDKIAQNTLTLITISPDDDGNSDGSVDEPGSSDPSGYSSAS